jgi:microcystin-dependent protein
MHRIEGENVNVINDKNYFSTSPPLTVVTPEWLNSLQEEIMNVIESSGLSILDQSDDTQDQLLTALRLITSLPIGSILPYGAGTNPNGFLICDGSAISRSTYASLYAVIGTVWGVGDGSTTFNIPDLQGIFLRGVGSHGSLQDANGTAFSGTLGSYQNDNFQSHVHFLQNIAVTGSAAGSYSIGAGAFAAINHTTPLSDGINGTPRTGVETNPANAGINYIIKY